MAVPPKDGATRPCGGVAPHFKCDQMATFRSTALPKDPCLDADAGTGMSGPQPAPPKYPGWCCPLGHFEAHEPPTT
jgi:hypothetical protein